MNEDRTFIDIRFPLSKKITAFLIFTAMPSKEEFDIFKQSIALLEKSFDFKKVEIKEVSVPRTIRYRETRRVRDKKTGQLVPSKRGAVLNKAKNNTSLNGNKSNEVSEERVQETN